MRYKKYIRCGIAILLSIGAFPTVASDLKYFDSNGTRLGYSIEGSGPPVMLLHGLMVDSEINWRARGTAALLAENFQVISLDMRGHGRSEKPRESKRYGVELVNDVIRLMDSLKINRAYVVGYSAGGEVVLKLMVTHPERVKSAAIGGTGWLRDSGPSYQAYMRVSERLSSLEPGDPIVSPSFGDGKYTAAEISTINENDPQAIAAFARSALELTISEDSLERNEVPALAIYGEIDAYRSDIELLVQRLANVTSIQIPDQDHDGTIGALEFRQNINSWLLNQETKQR